MSKSNYGYAGTAMAGCSDKLGARKSLPVPRCPVGAIRDPLALGDRRLSGMIHLIN